jgi:hypothetical protein
MPDIRPPRIAADELTTLQALHQFQRESLVRKLDGLSEDDARRSPVASGTTLLWLVKHSRRAERIWIVQRYAGLEPVSFDDDTTGKDTVASVIASYRAAWEEVDAIIAAAPSLDEPCRALDDDLPCNLRWCLLHLLEEIARHAGHADILRELIDGSTGR